MECSRVSPARKVKKKQVKDEMDRMKQAEKKKRRLEKALAASAAIRAELEKKKQMKKEEQQRLDEEGAAIAEAVALHVLLGEDSDDPCKIMLQESNIELFMGGLPHRAHGKCSIEGLGLASDGPHGFRDTNWSFSSGTYNRNHDPSGFGGDSWGPAGVSAGLIAAQAVSSLRIAEDAGVNSRVFNKC